MSVSIVFAGLWVSGQFDRLGMDFQRGVALALAIGLTNAAAILLMDFARRTRPGAGPAWSAGHFASSQANART